LILANYRQPKSEYTLDYIMMIRQKNNSERRWLIPSISANQVVLDAANRVCIRMRDEFVCWTSSRLNVPLPNDGSDRLAVRALPLIRKLFGEGK